MNTIGMVGVGNMGTPMAKNLIKAGYPVVVFDIDEKRMDHLAQAGAKKAKNAGDLASQSDVVLTVLTWPKVVEATVLEEGGILSSLKKGSILMECSSIDHETSIRIAEKVESAGCRYVEAALMGRPFEIEARGLYFLSAGKKETVQECEPIFQAIGKKNLYAGGFGTAKLLKIANAMFNATETMIMDEALTWCLDNGITQEGFLDLMKERRSDRAAGLEELLKGGGLDTHPSWTAKDVYHGLKLGQEKEIPMPVLATVNSVINQAKAQNREGYSFGGMMYKYYERLRKKS
ncbi:MAG: NAD(P)-binding domain-containing protein [Deltaproteobacteria bacterium]|nr:NAD(P)-binding domain-containing protein [Deltaproteobacteria bacterium]